MDEDRLQPNQLNMSGCSRADMAIMTMIIIIQKTFMTKKILFRRIKKNMNSVKKTCRLHLSVVYNIHDVDSFLQEEFLAYRNSKAFM